MNTWIERMNAAGHGVEEAVPGERPFPLEPVEEPRGIAWAWLWAGMFLGHVLFAHIL